MDCFHINPKKNVDLSFVHKKGIYKRLQNRKQKFTFSINSLPLCLQGEKSRERATLEMLPGTKFFRMTLPSPKRGKPALS